MESPENTSLITLADLLGDNEQENTFGEVSSNNHDRREVNDVVRELLSELLSKVWKCVKPLKRWRKANPNNWAENIAKRRRAEGLPYRIRSRERAAKIPKSVDCSKCQFKCTELFSETIRNDICRYYWNLDFTGKKNFILTYVAVQPPKRVLNVRKKYSQRSYTKKCFFPINEARVQVCQNFFCKTLCISPSVLVDAIKKRNSVNCFDAKDNRGKHEPSNKTKPETIQDIKSHIESFPSMESHHSRRDTKRKYLDKDLSIRKMYFK